jgi:hypothetical protein
MRRRQRLKSQQEAIKSTLLDYCQNRNLDSVKTTEGLFYRSVQKNYWTSDWDSMNKFVIENDCLELFCEETQSEQRQDVS